MLQRSKGPSGSITQVWHLQLSCKVKALRQNALKPVLLRLISRSILQSDGLDTGTKRLDPPS